MAALVKNLVKMLVALLKKQKLHTILQCMISYEPSSALRYFTVQLLYFCILFFFNVDANHLMVQ